MNADTEGVVVRVVSIPHRGRQTGFTLVEILVSIIVLGLAIIGLLGLMIATTKTSKEIVEDAYAANIARSVYEALRIAGRERSFVLEVEDAAPYRGLILVHDGVCSPCPRPAGDTPPTGEAFRPPELPRSATEGGAKDRLLSSDFVITFPARPADGTPGPTFVFPRPQSPPLKQNEERTDNTLQRPIVYNGTEYKLDIQRTYALKNREVPGFAREIANEYSFAIVTKLLQVPDLLDETDRMQPIKWAELGHLPSRSLYTDGLYQVEVLVFRNFDGDPFSPRHASLPGGHFVGLIALGPH